MQTSTTDHPAEDQVIAYVDGEASAEVVAHIATCSTCTEHARGYARTQGVLRRSLYRHDCPDAHTLGEYHLDLLEPQQRTRVAGHALECAECSLDLQTLRSYLAQPTPVTEPLVARARRMVATLFRPAPGLAYGGLRGSAEATTRVYQVEDITVTVGPGQGSGSLVGLVLSAGTEPQAFEGRTVRLVPADRAALAALIDDLGNFEFEDVPTGTYALQLELTGAVVVIEELRVD